MTDATFRSASEGSSKEAAPIAEPQNPARPVDAQTEVPIALQEEVDGVPYTAKYFEVQEIWSDPEIGLKDDIKEIESYYRQKVERRELKDGKSTYEGYIKELEKSTDSKNAPFGVRIAKLAEFARFMRKIEAIDRDKQKYSI